MKGTPWIEIAAVLAAVLLLSGPLVWLTRDAPMMADTPVAMDDGSASGSLEAWVEFHFSHVPVSWRLRQEGAELATGGGDLREDADVTLQVRDGRSDVVLEVEWGELEDQGYAEMTVEAGAIPAMDVGGWGDATTTYRWELIWPETP